MNGESSRSSPPAFAGASTGDEAAPPGGPSGSIRHAATVVVMRPGHTGREIYMVRRSAKSPFMPSTLVFPGGRLDPEDGPASDDAAWERAARRECEEETGLRLHEHPLRWFDTWLTPSAESRRRYLARFFVTQLPAGDGDHAEADGVETHEGRWATAAEHLAAWEAEQVDLPPPTVSVLLRLRDAEPDRLARMLDVDPRPPILPKVIAREQGVLIVLPHDPEYADAPGEAAPVPARAHDLPPRFVRDGRRWRPC
ncbi:MAG: NUDIX hydrolase [Nannocystaceae bacterium]